MPPASLTARRSEELGPRENRRKPLNKRDAARSGQQRIPRDAARSGQQRISKCPARSGHHHIIIDSCGNKHETQHEKRITDSSKSEHNSKYIN